MDARADRGVAPIGAVPPYDAVIFDMDGVVTDTAAVHAVAWRELFDAALADPRAGAAEPVEPFDPSVDYRRHVDGRAREDGVRAFLESRGVHVPTGDRDDPADAWTIHGLAARKNAIYTRLLAEGGVRVFPGTIALVQRLRAGGVPTALVTASRNADRLLEAAGLEGRFDVVVDGVMAGDLGLPGKPDPATFLEAARRLDISPERIAVVEDATSGVEAARRGCFGLVVGIDRTSDRAALEAAGADIVLDDVGLLDLGTLRDEPWVLSYAGFDPAHEGQREALTTLGNGYMGVRGAAAERRADGVHYPGTYLAGVYNRLTSHVEGREVEDEHTVNAPNWLLFDLRSADDAWWSTGGWRIGSERRDLDLRRGLLARRVLLTDDRERRLRVTQRRLVSMDRPHLAALETTLVADGWSGPVGVCSGIDADVTNSNVAEYAALADRHFDVVDAREAGPDTLLAEVETSQSRIRIATAVRTVVTSGSSASTRIVGSRDRRLTHRFEIELQDGEPAVVEKTMAIATSRDRAIASPALAVLDELSRARDGFDGLLRAHEHAWRRLWDQFGIALDADRETQLVLNLHVFHLLQTISRHTAQLDTGVPARGLSGEGYRGHVFWDELFVLPVIGTHLPAVVRALLDYRWRRLDAARDAARRAGLAGAMFPWQSGSDGREETPGQLFNLRSRRWMPDNSRRQLHVGLAVAYNAWQHYAATDDVAWLGERGAELVIEPARLFSALATHDPADDRFHITGVMGPDEYHDGYPHAPGGGLRDNAYTNVLAAWVCARAVDVVARVDGDRCDALSERLGIRAGEPERWSRLSRRIAVPFHDDGIVSQFDGYGALEEFDWPRYRATYGNIGRLDLILEAEGDTTNRYKVAKQADVLMLVYLLGPDALLDLFADLGHPITPDTLRRTVDYYLARTAHGSTLSRVVHASVLARIDRTRAWWIFRDALAADLDDTQGGTTREGIHLGAMAGTIDIVARAFAGLHVEADRLTLHPRLPAGLRRAKFRAAYRGQGIDVDLDHRRIRLSGVPCPAAAAVPIDVAGERVTLGSRESREFVLPARG